MDKTLNDFSSKQEFYDYYKSSLQTSVYHRVFLTTINRILKPNGKLYRDNVTSEVLESELKIADLLHENNLISTKQYDDFKYELLENNEKFIYFYTDNVWERINKLNTNYICCSYVFLNFLYDYKQTNYDVISILESIRVNPGKYNKEFELMLLSIVDDDDNRTNIYENYIMSDQNKKELEFIIDKTSNIGKNSENFVIEYLKDCGWEIIYVGGDGSVIDQYFSIDVIAKTPDNILKTIQIKTVESITPCKCEDLDLEHTFYKVSVLRGLYCNKANYSILILTTQRGDILGIEQQPEIKYINGEWTINENLLSFPSGYTLLIKNPYQDLITPSLLYTKPKLI